MVAGETLCPDLVVVTDRKQYIVDVSIHFEEGYSLEIGTKEKVNKYKVLSSLFQDCKEFRLSIIIVLGRRSLKVLGWSFKNWASLNVINPRQ